MRIKPDNFNARPNEWAGNQLGHASLGVIACYWASWVWMAAFGELPYAVAVLGLWAVVYLAIELPQGGGLFDTLEDIVWAVGISGALVLWGRDVFAAAPNAFDLLQWPMAVITILLAAGYIPRLMQAKKQGRDL